MLRRLKDGDFDALLALLGNRVFAIDTRERITILRHFPVIEIVFFYVRALSIRDESNSLPELMLART
jgi:hypothetical protein